MRTRAHRYTDFVEQCKHLDRTSAEKYVLLMTDRIDTSEFYQQTIFTASSGEPRVKASQCFTKYKYRGEAEADAEGDARGPAIVATQAWSRATGVTKSSAWMRTTGG